MAVEITDELTEKVLAVFAKKARIKKNLSVVDIQKGLKRAGVELSKREAKQVVGALTKDGTLEFTSYGGATFIKVSEETE